MQAFRVLATFVALALSAPVVAQGVDPIDPWDPTAPVQPRQRPGQPDPGQDPGLDPGQGSRPLPGSRDPVALAEAIQGEAEILTQILFRETSSGDRLVYNAGLLAKEANDVVIAAYSGAGSEFSGSVEEELRDVIEAHGYLQSQFVFARQRPSYNAGEQYRRVTLLVDALRNSLGGNFRIEPLQPRR